jgi:hypothetical protein
MSPTVTTGGKGKVDATFTVVAADGVTVVGTGKGSGRYYYSRYLLLTILTLTTHYTHTHYSLYSHSLLTILTLTILTTGSGGGTITSSSISIASPQLWSVARPYLYTLMVAVSANGKATDSANETVGIRNTAWDGERGLLLNEEQVKMRGACNHESFTGVGAALPDRIDLFRVQVH